MDLKQTTEIVASTNGRVSKATFQKLTDPGQPDPRLAEMGLNLRQSINGQQVYSYTGFRHNQQSVTPLWITIVDGEKMIVSATWRIGTEFSPFDYDRIAALVSECKMKYPDVRFPEDDYQPDFEQIPWEGEPLYNSDPDADDFGLEEGR